MLLRKINEKVSCTGIEPRMFWSRFNWMSHLTDVDNVSCCWILLILVHNTSLRIEIGEIHVLVNYALVS